MGRKRREHQTPRPFLGDDHDHASLPTKKQRSRPPKQHQKAEQLISSLMSSKILKEALIQQKEVQDEAEGQNPNNFFFAEDATDTIVLDGEDIDEFDGFSDAQIRNGLDEVEINEDDETLLDSFLCNDAGPQQTLTQVIAKRIRERDSIVSSETQPLPKLDQPIIELYKGVGKLLSRYTAGKMPKALKRVPSLQLWEEILYLTEPERWSPNAMYQVTRIFASNLNADRATHFYELVLLPRVREDIRKNKWLHFSLYQSLKKALYKPSAFFKGILFPLCESGTCNLREAVIIGSIIKKVSIPSPNASAALVMLAGMEYHGTTSYFIMLLLDKKYSLPFPVLKDVLSHFLRFFDDSRIMPVVWHQSLLTFVQRYKKHFTEKQKDKLRALMQKQKHKLVTPEIQRELDSGSNEDPTLSVVNKKLEEDRFDFPEVPMEN